MANIKPEATENSLWQGYGLQTPSSTTLHPPPYEANYTSGSQDPYHSQPHRGSYRSLDMPSMHTRPPPYETEGVLTASPPSLNSQHSYPSLKRGFSSTEESPYGEIVQDFREEIPEGPKPSISQDHKLLSFGKLSDKQAIVDNHGRVHQIDLSAQIHGMFFLSEMATPPVEGLVQPELTCYRRNLFQVSGTVTTPRGSLSIISERGERMPIVSMEVAISASESVEGHPVKLIVIPWKTPPPNSPEVGQGQEQEPSPVPLLPFNEGSSDINNEMSVYPIAYRRLQFRIATANNGRRRELQQHFTLHLDVIATLANGIRSKVCETSTSPIVVRGRSPRNFQARKEIPLVGSSSSRGGPSDVHVTTSVVPGVSSISAPVVKPKPTKSHTLELPRTTFDFDTSHLPPSPALMRTSTYPTYLPSNTPNNSTAPSTPSYQPPIGLDSYLQVNHSNQDSSLSSSTTTGPRNQPPPQQYSFQPSSTPSQTGSRSRFIDSNPRPAKSPRHVAPSDPAPSTSYNDFGSRFAPPYNGAGRPSTTEAAYFPTPIPLPQLWTAPSDTTGMYGTSNALPTVSQGGHYHFPQGYMKEERNQQQSYTWNPS